LLRYRSARAGARTECERGLDQVILRIVVLTLCGAVVAVAGFLVGRGLGGDPSAPDVGSVPSTLDRSPAEVEVPGIGVGTDFPALITTVETAAAAPSGGEDEGAGAASEVESELFQEAPEQNEGAKPEEKATPKSETTQPEGDITVGPPEE
jgi:hypothetical protein